MSVPDLPWPENPGALAQPAPEGGPAASDSTEIEAPENDAAAHDASVRNVTVRDAALERWFRDYFDLLWRIALRLGVPSEQVDDVVQEAFITAHRRQNGITPGSERRFLVSTTIKLSANQRRQGQSRQRTLEHAGHSLACEAPSAEQLLNEKQLRSLLELALCELAPDQRSVFVLHELEGFSAPEVAALLEIPLGTVASRLGRGRKKFSKAAARLRRRWLGGEEP